MTFKEMWRYFLAIEEANQSLPEQDKIHLTGRITFKQHPSWKQQCSRDSRTYIVCSSNKAFRPGLIETSIYGDTVDGSECVRLDLYMRETTGEEDGWEVESCSIDWPNSVTKRMWFRVGIDVELTPEEFCILAVGAGYDDAQADYDKGENILRAKLCRMEHSGVTVTGNTYAPADFHLGDMCWQHWEDIEYDL